jgi:hypothetical protein
MNIFIKRCYKVKYELGVNKKKFKIIPLLIIKHLFCRYICNHNIHDVFQKIHTQ